MKAASSRAMPCRYRPTRDAIGATFESHGQSWRAVAGHARFECELEAGFSLEAGWYWVDIALQSQEGGSLAPVLYPDFGDGALESRGISLESAWSEQNGCARGVILLPFSARRLEFSPGSGYRLFTMGAFSLHRLSRPSALLRLIFFPRGRLSLLKGIGRLFAALKLTRGSGLQSAASSLYRSFYKDIGGLPGSVAYGRRAGPEQPSANRRQDFDKGPLFSILMPVFNTPVSWFNACVESVFAQSYGNWELCIADDASDDPSLLAALAVLKRRDARIKIIRREVNGHISEATNSALDLATGVYALLLDHDDLLHIEALGELASAIAEHPQWELIYTDEDKVDSHGRRSGAYAKLDFGPDLLRSQNFVSHLGAYKTSRLKDLGGLRPGYEGSQDWDLTLRFSELVGSKAIGHIPRVLYHWRISDQSTAADVMVKPYIRSAAKKALEDHLLRVGLKASVRELATAPGQFRIDYVLGGDVPRVAIVIDIRGHSRDVLDRCLNALWRSTEESWRPDIFVMDDGGAGYSHALITKLQRVSVGGLAYGAACETAGASCQLLLFLQPTVDGFRDGWLKELVTYASREDVGAAGPRIYSSGRWKSDGLVELRGTWDGVAVQDYQGSMPTSASYLSLPRNVASLPLNGLLIRADLFRELSTRLRDCTQENFGAVLSSELLSAGKLLVHTPFAELYEDTSEPIS
jgi:GT2 family glycosyltransferase